jgi:hypothetical protein
VFSSRTKRTDLSYFISTIRGKKSWNFTQQSLNRKAKNEAKKEPIEILEKITLLLLYRQFFRQFS